MKSAFTSTSLTASPGLQVHSRKGLDANALPEVDLHLAIGMFDGVHIGHQAVIRQAMEAASSEEGHFCGVLTFDPHPSKILHPEGATSLIMPLSQRIDHMLAAGADCVFVQTFSRDYARQSAVDFLPLIKGQFPGLRSIHVGQNFRFGEGRRGNVNTLHETSEPLGVELHALERKLLDGVAVSSSRIRAALMEGAMNEVNAMLGEPYAIDGTVKKGRGIGRTIDFPTLNIGWSPEVSPRLGVYRVLLQSDGMEEACPAVANYGLRPTVGSHEEPLLEIHLLDSGNIPSEGDDVRVAFLNYLRPEKTFESVEALKEQIAQDVALARQQFEA